MSLSASPEPSQKAVDAGDPGPEERMAQDPELSSRPDSDGKGGNGAGEEKAEEDVGREDGEEPTAEKGEAKQEKEEDGNEKKKEEMSDRRISEDGGGSRKKDRKEKKERKERDRDRRDRTDRDRGRDRDQRRRRTSRSRSRSRSRDRSRDRDRDRRRRSRSRSRSRDRGDRRRDRYYRDSRRSRSRSRDRRRRSWSREDRARGSRRDARGRRRSRSPSSDSDIGGYVPRKRQESRARAAEEGPYSSAFGVNTFDKAPSVTQSKPAPAPIDPAEALRKLQEQQLQARQLVLQQQAASAAAAASKTQREVYVGNLAVGLVTDEVLRTLFNNALMAAFPQHTAPGMEPVVNVSMHSDGRYAFVELRNPEMATEALKIAGLQLLGQAISVGRPSGFVDPSAAAAQAAQAAAALQQFRATGVMPGAQPGAVATPAALPGAAAMPATAVLPGQVLPGPPPLPAGMVAPGGVAPAAVVGAAAATGGAPAGVPAAQPGAATPCICVVNMFTEAVLMDEEEYVDVMQDLQEECGKLGNVVDLKVPKPSGPGMVGQGNFGKAFVVFSSAQEAQSAKDTLHGRSFDGQVLDVTFVPGIPTE